ncbi:MAG TPA: hypothetical protein VNM15_04935 [Candidatus Binatia bacterium]|nr:hypothetical protein [Candidatus Binatia bacterium]
MEGHYKTKYETIKSLGFPDPVNTARRFELMASALLDAEVRLGELFAAMEKDRSFHGNQFGDLSSVKGHHKTKYETIKSLGFPDPVNTAHRFELMAKHKDIVERVNPYRTSLFGGS